MLVTLKSPNGSIKTDAGVTIQNHTFGVLAQDVSATHVAVQFYEGGAFVAVPKAWLVPAIEPLRRTAKETGA